jgi:hypothetical protein
MKAFIFSIPVLLAATALAQTPGTFTTGQVLTAPELNSAFAGKQDYPPPPPPAPATAPPLMDGTAAAGASALYARQDHIHPSDTSRLPLAGGTMTGAIVLPGNPTANLQAATKQYVDGAITPPVATACGGTAGAILSLDGTGANCVAATGIAATASGPNVGSGYYYQYNGVNAFWAQTALNSYYMGQSGNPLNTGNQLTGLGFHTLLSNTTGSGNSATGAGALAANTTGSFNNASGLSALGLNTAGNNNSATGANALGQLAQAGSNDNSAFGFDSQFNNQTGLQNTAIGSNSLLNLGTPVNATAMVNGNAYTILTAGTTTYTTFGAASNTPGTAFTAAFPATTITGGSYNSGTGAVSLTLNANIGLAAGSPFMIWGAAGTGANIASLNVASATAAAGTTGTTLNYTIATGLTISTITGGNAWLTGFGTGTVSPNATRNIGIGYQSGTRTIDGSFNTFIGGDPGTLWPNNTKGKIWIGDGNGTSYLHNFGPYNANGSSGHNVFIGENAGNYTMTAGATDNLSMGYQTMRSLTSGTQNIAIGSSALNASTTAGGNVAVGTSAMLSTTTSGSNVGVGTFTLENMTTGNGANVAIGQTAGLNVTTGSNNTFVGGNAGRGITTGTNNSVLGQYQYGANASATIVLAAGPTNEMDFGLTTAALWTAAAGMAVPQLISNGAPVTVSGTCAVTATGGKNAGTLTVPAGGCTAGQTIIITPGIAAPAGWTCNANNETAVAASASRPVAQSAHTATTATMLATAALSASDIISFTCRGY